MQNKYIAVTIGPIFDTINLASSPSALWAASYLFSMLSKNICLTLTEQGVKKEDIISPYYDPADELLNKNDGVGLFHDRIIFRVDHFSIKDFPKIKDEAIKKTLDLFQFGKEAVDYFKKYFLIAAYAFESESPIMDSAKALDCLELAKPFAEEKGKNPLLTLYTSDDQGHKNQQITTLVGNMGIQQWQLFNSNHQVMSLEQIAKNRIPANAAGDYKKYKYYAVIRSDGDHMGDIIKELKQDDTIRDFSHDCLSYCAGVAEEVKKFGGVTIYSGGDDLLALIPVENFRAETVFDFIQAVNGIFKESFKNYPANVSLSFGVFISYYKFPLYEALEKSAALLFGTAKQYRNCTAVHVQKHAGQSEGLVIFNDSMDDYINLHQQITSEKKKENSQIILSAMHKLTLFEKMFNAAAAEEEIRNLFDNTFDADAHKGNTFLKKVLADFFIDLKNKLHIYPITDEGVLKNKEASECKAESENAKAVPKDIENRVRTLNFILRVIKFFTETGGEEQ